MVVRYVKRSETPGPSRLKREAYESIGVLYALLFGRESGAATDKEADMKRAEGCQSRSQVRRARDKGVSDQVSE